MEPGPGAALVRAATVRILPGAGQPELSLVELSGPADVGDRDRGFDPARAQAHGSSPWCGGGRRTPRQAARAVAFRRMSGGSRLHDRRPVRRVVPVEGTGVDRRAWPASIPAVAQLLRDGLELPSGVTLLVGENGTGKSTVVEAVAMAFGLAPEGGTRHAAEGTRPTESPLHQWITLERAPGAPRWGLFLRAETMHGYFTRQESFATTRDPRFHEMCHGESFLEVLRTRFDSPGLYCLDEPEAALSCGAQIALVGTLHDLAGAGTQVLCATHSPLLAALPGARLLEVGDWGIRETRWKDLELVDHWRRYLDEPMRYLRHVIDTT